MKKVVCLGIESTAHTFGVSIVDSKANILTNVKDSYITTKGGIVPNEAAEHHKKVKEKLKKEKKEFKENIELGIMIETPSAALISDKLAEEVDFFSIGTNDLIQYTIAVDRINNKIAHLYQPCHPSVLKLIKQVIENGHKKGIWVGLCGEMASIPEIALLLIGMGIDELSMSPISIPEVKKAIRKFSFKKLKKISEKIFEFSTHSDIINYLKENLKIE